MLYNDKIKAVEQLILQYEDELDIARANRCRSKLEFLLAFENRVIPKSDGKDYKKKY